MSIFTTPYSVGRYAFSFIWLFRVWDSDPLRLDSFKDFTLFNFEFFLVQCYSFQSAFINDLLTFRHSHSSRPKFTSMIAVVEFRTKKATRSWYMLTQKVAIFWLSKSKIFSLKNIKLWEEFLLQMLFNYFHFLKSDPILGELQSIQINFDGKIIGV